MTFRGWTKLPLAAALALPCLLAIPPRPAHAQIDSREGIALQNQILEMRRDLQTLRDQVARGGGGGSARSSGSGGSGGGEMTTQLLDRVTSLEEQMRTLRGRIDEIDNRTRQQGQDLSKQIGDLGFRVQNLEGGGARPGAVAPPVAAGPAPTPLTPGPSGGAASTTPTPPPGVQPPRRPEVALQDGNAALARRDYAGAEVAARDVLTNARTSPRAYDAQFLLAQSYAGRRDWSNAAIAYDDTYNRSRTGAHAQDALLGLANSLIGLGDKRAGCSALGKLKTEFPSPRPDLRDPIASARQRGGC